MGAIRRKPRFRPQCGRSPGIPIPSRCPSHPRRRRITLREELAEARRTTARRLDDHRQKVSKAQGQARQDMLAELAALPLRDRLLQIASDDVHPLHFYPTELATGSLGELDGAGKGAVARIKAKASLIPKGPWKQWFKAINEEANQ